MGMTGERTMSMDNQYRTGETFNTGLIKQCARCPRQGDVYLWFYQPGEMRVKIVWRGPARGSEVRPHDIDLCSAEHMAAHWFSCSFCNSDEAHELGPQKVVYEL